MDTIKFPYRSTSHLPLLYVIEESGAWENHGLEVDDDFWIGDGDAREAFRNGDLHFVGGSHISPYYERATGDQWVYLGQSTTVSDHRLIVRADSDIYSPTDLKGKTIGPKGSHPQLNNRLFLKQHGLHLEDDDYEFGDIGDKRHRDAVKDGDVDAAFIHPPVDILAERMGLRVIELEPLPMIRYTTVSTYLPFVLENEDLVERFLKALLEGIAFFMTNPEEAADVIQENYTADGELDHEAAAHVQSELSKVLSPKLFPTLDGIRNAYQEAVWSNEDALKVEPLELWDFHYLRKIQDSGFVDDLYAGTDIEITSSTEVPFGTSDRKGVGRDII